MNDKVTEQTRTVELDPSPKAKLRSIGGSGRDEWNGRLANLVVNAVPNSSDEKQKDELATAVISGLVDMKPEDPIEGVLIGQIIAAKSSGGGIAVKRPGKQNGNIGQQEICRRLRISRLTLRRTRSPNHRSVRNSGFSRTSRRVINVDLDAPALKGLSPFNP